MVNDTSAGHCAAARIGQGGAAAEGPRRSAALHRAEALRLLGTVSLGRIVFTRHALPAIHPVPHLVDDGDIVLRTHEGAALTIRDRWAGAGGVVVAYEADAIDTVTHLGWSVVVTGYCHLVTDPDALARYRRLLRPGWSRPDELPRRERPHEHVLRIRPDLVTGVRLTA